ncbi:MAG: outer membrane beta-barrel protein [Coxiellaceae bacterium]|nr:outer membrane beta-barrel protein [Coxiellaceae bacterium]
MISRRVMLGVVGSAAILLSMEAVAGGVEAPANDNVLSGLYVGGNVGYGKTNLTMQDVDTGNNISTKNKGFVWGANAGYEFTKNWAVEAGYTQMPNVKIDQGTTANQNRIFDIVAKGIYPFNDKFNVFGKLGAAYTHTHTTSLTGIDNPDQSSGAIVPYFGAGVGYNLTQNVSLNVQGFATTKRGNSVPAMYGATAGLQYNF